jgi:hypothetical protein
MQLRIVQLSPFSGYFPSLRSEYLPQHPILKHPYKTADIFIVLCCLIFVSATSCSTCGGEERCVQGFGGEI